MSVRNEMSRLAEELVGIVAIGHFSDDEAGTIFDAVVLLTKKSAEEYERDSG